MTDEEWRQILYFKPSEFDADGEPGSGKEMDRRVIFGLEKLRTLHGPFIVTAGFATYGHAPDSYHYRHMAVDGFFKRQKDVRKIIEDAFRIFEFRGIGIYTDWHYKGAPVIGFHFDCRDDRPFAIWKRDRGNYTYFLGGIGDGHTNHK